MQCALQLSFDGFARSNEFEDYIRDRLEALAEVGPPMQSCSVALRCAAPQGADRCQYDVSIECRVAGTLLKARHDHEDNIMVALTYALLAMRRQFAHVRRRPQRAPARHGQRVAQSAPYNAEAVW